jgi:hypothetical protein
MELLDKGKHCEEEYCHQLDYLPIKCKACSKFFCTSHIMYDAHGCTESHKLNYKIPMCPLCSQTVEFVRGKDLDLCLAKHMSECDLNGNKTKLTKSNRKKCSFEKCKTKDSLSFECPKCFNIFCINHRIQEDHKCTTNYQNCAQQAKTRQGNNIFYLSVKSF